MSVRSITADELDDVVIFIANAQSDPARSTSYLIGEEPPRVRDELDALRPSWTTTARVVGDEAITGAVIVEIDNDLGRAWILGPWADDWDADAAPLLDAALAQLDGVNQVEVSALLDNTRLQQL